MCFTYKAQDQQANIHVFHINRMHAIGSNLLIISQHNKNNLNV